MSFGGMLTGGDEEKKEEKVNIEAKVEKEVFKKAAAKEIVAENLNKNQ
jgi:Na+-transporting NADH:ubiquinone oxidoreductase subunit E